MVFLKINFIYVSLHIIIIKSLKSVYLFSLAVKINNLSTELARAVARSLSWHASAPDHSSSKTKSPGKEMMKKLKHKYNA